jgi:hypothetical protein
MWQKFRSLPWWAQTTVWICVPPVVFSVWLWERAWATWLRVALAVAAFALWSPVVVAAVGGDSRPASQPEAKSPQGTTSAATTTSQATSTAVAPDYSALAGNVLDVQQRVLRFSDKLKGWRHLPKDVRRAYSRLERLLGGDATITAAEVGQIKANLAVLRNAISSGELRALVAQAKAEARERRLAREQKKAEEAEAAAAAAAGSNCNPNYSGCLKPNSSDYDCAGGSGNGPDYTGTVEVLGYDEYGLDADGDGIGCE